MLDTYIARLSNCGNPLKLKLPPYDRNIRIGTRAKVRKIVMIVHPT